MTELNVRVEEDPDGEFNTYYCPHCDKPFAKGQLISVKLVCPNCNKFFVMEGCSVVFDKH